jgi:hypothetical protein
MSVILAEDMLGDNNDLHRRGATFKRGEDANVTSMTRIQGLMISSHSTDDK